MQLFHSRLISEAVGVGIHFSSDDPVDLTEKMTTQPQRHRADFKALTGYVLRTQPRQLEGLAQVFRGQPSMTVRNPVHDNDIAQRRMEVISYCLDMSDLDETNRAGLFDFYNRHDTSSDLHTRMYGWLRNLPLCALSQHLDSIVGMLKMDAFHGESRYSRLLRLLIENAVELDSYHVKEHSGAFLYERTRVGQTLVVLDNIALLNGEDNVMRDIKRDFEIIVSPSGPENGHRVETLVTARGQVRTIWDYTP